MGETEQDEMQQPTKPCEELKEMNNSNTEGRITTKQRKNYKLIE